MYGRIGKLCEVLSFLLYVCFAWGSEMELRWPDLCKCFYYWAIPSAQENSLCTLDTRPLRGTGREHVLYKLQTLVRCPTYNCIGKKYIQPHEHELGHCDSFLQEI